LSFMLIGDVIIGAALISLAIGFSIARLY